MLLGTCSCTKRFAYTGTKIEECPPCSCGVVFNDTHVAKNNAGAVMMHELAVESTQSLRDAGMRTEADKFRRDGRVSDLQDRPFRNRHTSTEHESSHTFGGIVRAKNWNNEGKARITSLSATGRKPGKGRAKGQQKHHYSLQGVAAYSATKPAALHETHSDVWGYFTGVRES